MSKLEEIIAMLKELRDSIKPMSLCTPMETAIHNVYGSNVNEVLNVTIKYLERLADENPRTTAEETVEMLETLIGCIYHETSFQQHTVLRGVRHDSTEFVLKEAIKHIRKGE